MKTVQEKRWMVQRVCGIVFDTIRERGRLR